MSQHRRIAIGAAVVLVVAGLTVTPAASAAEPPNCAAFEDPVYQRVNPATTSSLLTPWSSEASKAGQYGYTDDRGVLFEASVTADATLTPVHRLWQAGSGDFRYAADADDVAAAIAKGYVDQGSRFSASTSAASCLSAVYSYTKAGHQRLAVADDDRAALTGSGWAQDGVAFYARSTETAPRPPTTPTDRATTIRRSASPSFRTPSRRS